MRARDGYLDVLRLPHAARPFVSAMLGRLAYATVTLSLLLSIQTSTGSFAVAGAATGAFGVTNVIASPYRARVADRYGPARALLAMGTIFGGLLAATAAACLMSAAASVLVGLAAGAGLFAPPTGSTMRVIWAALAPSQRILTRAYSLDAVSEELVFTAGPMLVGLVLVVSTPVVALFGTAIIAFAGSALFSRAPIVRSRTGITGTTRARERPLRQRGFAIVLVALAGVGIVLGTIETAVPAFAAERSSTALAGVLMALLSAASGAAGLVYGHRTWRSTLAMRMTVLSVALAGVSALASAAGNELALAFVLVCVGTLLAPTVITGYLLADALAAEHVRNEASSWINTAINAGAAGGAALAGVLVDHTNTTVAFAVGAGIAALATLGASSRMPSVRRETGAGTIGENPVPASDHRKALPEGRA